MPQSSSTCLTVSAGFLRRNGQSEDAGSTRSSVKVSKARTFRREGFILIGFEKLRLQVEGISCRSYEYMPLELRLTSSNLIGRRRSGENLVVLVLKSGKSSKENCLDLAGNGSHHPPFAPTSPFFLSIPSRHYINSTSEIK